MPQCCGSFQNKGMYGHCWLLAGKWYSGQNRGGRPEKLSTAHLPGPRAPSPGLQATAGHTGVTEADRLPLGLGPQDLQAPGTWEAAPAHSQAATTFQVRLSLTSSYLERFEAVFQTLLMLSALACGGGQGGGVLGQVPGDTMGTALGLQAGDLSLLLLTSHNALLLTGLEGG